MSLINDALKRAKQAQAQSSQAGDIPHLRPADPIPANARRGVLIISVITGAAMGISLFIAWRAFQGHPAEKKQLPRELSQSATPGKSAAHREGNVGDLPVEASVQETPSPKITSSLQKISQPAKFEQNLPGASSGTAIVSAPAGPPNPSSGDSISDNSPAVSALPLRPEPLRLQGIVFSVSHPAAMIAGKMLFIGDRLGEWRVTAITSDSATLITAGQTNTLTLPQ
jgi:hypothetical protein